MSYVRRVKDSSGNIITNLYEKVATDADIFRINSADPGRIHTAAVAGASATITLPWDYLVGYNQLMVYRVDATTGYASRLFSNVFWTPIGLPTVYYIEVSSSSVTVLNGTGGPIRAVFYLPHVATPGQLSGKIVLTNQGDSIGIDMTGAGNGFVLTSVSGNRYLIRVDDQGNMGAESV